MFHWRIFFWFLAKPSNEIYFHKSESNIRSKLPVVFTWFIFILSYSQIFFMAMTLSKFAKLEKLKILTSINRACQTWIIIVLRKKLASFESLEEKDFKSSATIFRKTLDAINHFRCLFFTAAQSLDRGRRSFLVDVVKRRRKVWRKLFGIMTQTEGREKC